MLKTAGLEHSEARRRTESATRYFAAATEEISQGRGYDLLASVYSEEPELVLPKGTVLHGLRPLIEDLDGDVEAGMKMHLTKVIASKDITIIEADFENPPDDPFHCPPATTQVHFQRGGLTHRVHIHFAPRPRREGD